MYNMQIFIVSVRDIFTLLRKFYNCSSTAIVGWTVGRASKEFFMRSLVALRSIEGQRQKQRNKHLLEQ